MTTSLLRLAVLASGHGSNLQAVIDAIANGKLSAQIVGVFSDKPDAGALARARQAGLPAIARSPREFVSRCAHDEALFSEIVAVQPDLIVCAGYMRLISEAAVNQFIGRMINLHPSLLPKYPGLHTHRRAIDAGDTEHGASVHMVIPALDAGPVLAQVRVTILPGDSPESLAQRLLCREHALLVQSLSALARGSVTLSADGIFQGGKRLSAPLQLGDHDQWQALQ